ncbi:MAG: hypothetical protein GEU90_11090 [Gemmatimonas sp.]|nr:hypothetical protein [Gemmatimonas sp.]
MTMVDAMYSPTSNDTTVNGEPFSDAHPSAVPTYAAGAPWFLRGDSIMVNDTEYVKFGVTRVIEPSQLAWVGTHMGTSVFAEAGTTTPQAVVYVPVMPGCEFQPYQERQAIRPRG